MVPDWEVFWKHTNLRFTLDNIIPFVGRFCRTFLWSLEVYLQCTKQSATCKSCCSQVARGTRSGHRPSFSSSVGRSRQKAKANAKAFQCHLHGTSFMIHHPSSSSSSSPIIIIIIINVIINVINMEMVCTYRILCSIWYECAECAMFSAKAWPKFLDRGWASEQVPNKTLRFKVQKHTKIHVFTPFHSFW